MIKFLYNLASPRFGSPNLAAKVGAKMAQRYTNNIEEAIFLGDRIMSLKDKLPGRVEKVYPVSLSRPREQTDMDFLELRHCITEECVLTL